MSAPPVLPTPLTVEIRSYRLRPGTRDAFHRLITTTVAPMLRRWRTDLVRHGPSPHDGSSYLLIRAYADLEARQREQDAFYGSAEWREGPRQAVLDPIEEYLSVVLEMDAATVDALRQE
nr:NIPSNAP family protein [Pseudoxanthomonas sp.]